MNRRSLPLLVRSAALAASALLILGRPLAAAGDPRPLLLPGPVVEIGVSSGKFDFLEVDPVRHRLLASHEKDGTADFIDLDTHKLITRLKLGAVVHIIPDQKRARYYCSAQDEQTIVVVDAAKLEPVTRLKLEGELDALLLLPAHARLYAAHDNGTHLWAVDTATLQPAGEVAIPGAPEIMVYDAAADRIYLNIKTVNAVVAIDPNTNRIVAQWATAPALSPHGLVLDSVRQRIYVAGGNGKLVALDVKTGRVLAVADIAKNVDQAAFDARTGRIYCAGEKQLSVVEASDTGLKALGSVPTHTSARNVAVDPQTGAVWTTYVEDGKAYARSWLRP